MAESSVTFRGIPEVGADESPCLYCCQRCETVPGGVLGSWPRSRICTACGRSYILAGEYDTAPPETQLERHLAKIKAAAAEIRAEWPMLSDEVYTTDLPRFVQRRGYDKGVLVARIVRDPQRRFGQATIEGTRLSPFDLAAELDDGATPERVAEEFSLTVEQVIVARDWLAAHPECPNPRHANTRSRSKCPDCDDHGYVYSAEEMAEIRRVDEEVRRLWERLPSAS